MGVLPDDLFVANPPGAGTTAPSRGAMPSALNSLPVPWPPFSFGAGAPGLGDRLSAGLLGFANSNAPLPAIANLINGLATGQRSDAQGVAERQHDQARAATYQALRDAGLPDSQARAGALDPTALRTILSAAYAKTQAATAGQPQQAMRPPQPQPAPAPPVPGASIAPNAGWYAPYLAGRLRPTAY